MKQSVTKSEAIIGFIVLLFSAGAAWGLMSAKQTQLEKDSGDYAIRISKTEQDVSALKATVDDTHQGVKRIESFLMRDNKGTEHVGR
jgi:hypothetical protein